MKKAFTLIELLIVIIIVGVLAAVAIPNYTNMVERAKADQATTYLRVIRTAEKIYYSSNETYIVCNNVGDLKNIGAEITEESYTFTVAGNPDIADSFLATAARRNTDPAVTITLDDDGAWGGTSPYIPAD